MILQLNKLNKKCSYYDIFPIFIVYDCNTYFKKFDWKFFDFLL